MSQEPQGTNHPTATLSTLITIKMFRFPVVNQDRLGTLVFVIDVKL